jgi:hypothetical protein
VDHNSVVEIVPCYGPDGLKIESWWGARFSVPTQTGPGAHSASCIMGTESLLLGVKRPWHGIEYPPQSSTEAFLAYYRLNFAILPLRT